MQCTGEGKWGPCQSQTLPVSEKCDGKDNDCDGKVDETWEELGNVCTLGVGECKRPGKFVCSQDQTSTQCDAQPGKPVEEICDGKDNDCNGSIDENLNRDCFSNSAGQAMQGCTQENNGAWTCKGACQVGRQSCNSGSWQACKGFVQQSKETCDGKDNDCNGQVDEIQCECQNGQVRACGSSTGECKEGKQTCASGKWSSCVGKVDSTSEVCDGKDNDCDGITDENLSQDCQTGCGKGTRICTGGQFGDCSARKPTLETCGDKVDNDCDGKIDENCCFPSARFKAIGIELNTAEVVATSKTSNAWVASAHGNNIVLWDNTKKVIIRVLYGHTREVAGLVFAGKDQFLISSSADNTVRLFEVSTGKLLDTLSLGSIAYALVAQAPNYTRVTGVTYSLTSSRLRNIDLNTTTRKLSLSSNSIYGAFRSLAYSDDGKWFAATRGNAVHVYYGNTKKGELLDGRLGPSLYGVAIVSNKYVVAGYDNWLGSRGLKVWELASRKLLFSYKFPRGERANSMIAGAKGKRIVTVHRDRKMRLWELDIKGKKFRQKKEYSTSSSGFASPVRTYDSKHFFAPDQRVLLAWDLDKGGEKYRLNSAVRQVSYSSKGSLLVTTHASGMLRVFDAKNWTAKAAWKVADVSLETLALHPDETTAAVGVQKEVLVVNLTSQTTLRTLKGFRGFINRLVYHPVTQQLIVATSTGELSIFDNSGKLVKKLSGHGVSIYALAVSPDGKHLLSADRNKTILLWNTSTWSFKKLVGPATALLDAAFSPDSKQLAVLEAANQNNSLRIWDIANARWLTGLSPNYDTQASQDELHLVLYSSNNQWLLSTRSNIMTVYRNGATPSFYASQTPSYYDLRVTWSPIQSEVVITQENGRLDVFRCPTVAPTP
jgi:WD40 repeat protein